MNWDISLIFASLFTGGPYTKLFAIVLNHAKEKNPEPKLFFHKVLNLLYCVCDKLLLEKQ